MISGALIYSHPPRTPIFISREAVVPRVSPPKTPVTLLFVGDIMLSRSVGDTMQFRNDWTWPFTRIASATRLADVAFGNLETTISTRGFTSGCGFCFRANPRVVEGLLYGGFDVLSVANNHIWDYGRPAFDDTIAILASNGMQVVGGGRTLDGARGPVVVTVRGTKIAYLAYTDILPPSSQATATLSGANRYDALRMAEDIVHSRTLADVVIVSFHTGTEYEALHNTTQERIYRAAIDAGADLIVGHHPHVVQDIEQYKNKWIVYSLGNFIFDQNWSLATRQGMMLDVVVENGSITSLATRSIDISTQYQPALR